MTFDCSYLLLLHACSLLPSFLHACEFGSMFSHVLIPGLVLCSRYFLLDMSFLKYEYSNVVRNVLFYQSNLLKVPVNESTRSSIANQNNHLVRTPPTNTHRRALDNYNLKAHLAPCLPVRQDLLNPYLSISLTRCTCSSIKASTIVSRPIRGAMILSSLSNAGS